jgi:predicted PurR-regulated permease PerM
VETLKIKWPIYLKLSSISILMLIVFFVLYVGKEIIVPFLFSLIIAILLNPVVNFLSKKKINRTIAIIISVVISLAILIGIFSFIISQASMFADSLPQFKIKFEALFNTAINWISENSNISKSKILNWINETKAKGISNGSNKIGTALIGFGSSLILILLIPIYVFLILFYKPLLLEFISKLFRSNDENIVDEILSETKFLIQSYLVGLLIELAIVAALNSIGLLILGIQYAILLGIIGSLLNLIPYLGGIIAISLPMLIALATKSPINALWVLILYSIIQLVDNNFLIPKIVASKVKVNALVSIIVVLVGGAFWGIAGMFLALPFIAIAKVIFDRIPQLEPFGFLIGDNQPDLARSILKHK